MESAAEPLGLEEAIARLLTLMRDIEGADDRTLERIFKRAQRVGRATHRGKLGTYKYHSYSHSFGLVQPSHAETERNPRDGLNKSVDCSSTHRKLSRADGLFRVSLGYYSSTKIEY